MAEERGGGVRRGQTKHMTMAVCPLIQSSDMWR